MAEYTAEPWRRTTGHPTRIVKDDHPSFIICDMWDQTEVDRGNSERIVACVNACANGNPAAVSDMADALAQVLLDQEACALRGEITPFDLAQARAALAKWRKFDG